MYRHKLEKYKDKINKIVDVMSGGSDTLPIGLAYPQEPTCNISPLSTKIIKAHGALTGEQFLIYEGVRIITVVNVGELCPLSEIIETNLTHFYERGYTLFTDNDTTNILTENGSHFLSWANTYLRFGDGDGDTYQIRNHVGTASGLIVNDSKLSFIGAGCGREACSINCINKKIDGKVTIVPNKIPMWYGYKNISDRKDVVDIKLVYYPVERILLKELIKKEGPGTYILFACRSFDEGLPESVKRLVRQTSSLAESK